MSRYRRAIVEGGTYFFTVTLANRDSNLLTDRICDLREGYWVTQRELPFETVVIAILPDHLHAVWRLPEGDSDYSSRWQLIKAQFSKRVSVQQPVGASKIRKGEKGIWQRRFWEHLVRDERDLERHVDYVHYNPVKHGWASRVSDWPYSSFYRYVRDALLPLDWGGGVAIEKDEQCYGE